ncbi:hypothetical protein OG444_21165 [Streptomyces sp. NBC_01232]|uniref:hypothetical protein n=1 Tax=unclassified Streptomyces TaxID=2593676 RepID=UPI002E11F61C|nr:hypothetical protein OG444_21165 [Streptomyces sp. NBC_01232]
MPVVLSHFTIWTNILVAVVLGLSAARAWRRLVTPAGALLDFLLLTAPRTLRPRHAAQWLAYPLAHVTFALIRGPAKTGFRLRREVR